MPHQPSYNEITDGFTNETHTLSGTFGAPYPAATVPVRSFAAECYNFYASSITIVHGNAQAFCIVLPYDMEESEFYFYSLSVYTPSTLNFIPFTSVVAGPVTLDSVQSIQTVLPSHGRSHAGFSHCHARGVLQPAPGIPGVLPTATSVILGFICSNNTGASITSNLRISIDTRRFDEPRYVTEAR